MKRELRRLLEDVAAGEIGPAVARRAKDLLETKRSSGPKKRPASLGSAYAHAAARRRREADAEREAIARMHSEVWAWNIANTRGAPAGRCDNDECARPFRHTKEGELDHFIERSQGGEHARANGWRLCSSCHRDKTENRPGRVVWNQRRRRYCARAGLPFVPRRER